MRLLFYVSASLEEACLAVKHVGNQLDPSLHTETQKE